jgi:repressor LexA
MYKHNLTKADVIRATGITRPTLVNWERGRSMPRVKTLQILAEFFEVPVSYFLEE